MHLTQRDWIKWSSPQVRRGAVGQSRTCRDAALTLPHCLTLRRLAHFTIWAPFFTSTESGYIRGEGVGSRRGARVEKRWDEESRTTGWGNISTGEWNKGDMTDEERKQKWINRGKKQSHKKREDRKWTGKTDGIEVWETDTWRKGTEGEKKKCCINNRARTKWLGGSWKDSWR